MTRPPNPSPVPPPTDPVGHDAHDDRPAAALRPRVRSRRRDVARLRSTTRPPGKPPGGLVRDTEGSPASTAPAPRRRSAPRSHSSGTAAEPDGPVSLDPTEQLAPAFAEHAGLRFDDPEPLRLALTHRSILHDWSAAGLGAIHLGRPMQSNERLEFLGDAMLGAIVAEELYRRFPGRRRGHADL